MGGSLSVGDWDGSGDWDSCWEGRVCEERVERAWVRFLLVG